MADKDTQYLDFNQSGSPRDKGSNSPEMTSAERREFKMVMDLYSTGKRVRKQYDENWGTYYDFYKGKQWKAKRPSYKASPNINLIRATIHTVLPIMTDTSPGFDVDPRDPTDYKFADLISKAIQVWWERNGLDHTMVEVIMDALMYCAGILKVSWDQDADEGLGDIRVSVVDPHNLFIPDSAEDFDTKCPWVIQRLYMSIGEVKRRFPEAAKKLESSDGGTTNKADRDQEQKTYSGDITLVSPVDRKSPYGSETTYPASNSTDGKEVEILECWMDDDSVEEYQLQNPETGEMETGWKKKYPTGKVITLLPEKNMILQSKANPYKDGKKPYVRFVDTLIPRQFWGEGEIEPLIEIQKLINKNIAVLVDWMNMMTNPVWIVDNEAGVDPLRLTNQIGAIILKNKGSEVRREQAPQMPPQMFELYQSFRQLADTFSGIHDVTQGRRPTGVTSGEAINELQQAAQTRIRLKERNLQVSLTQFGYLVVSRMLQYYNEPRMIRITGEKELPSFSEFYVEEVEEDEGSYTYTKRDFAFDPQTGTYYPREWETGDQSKGMFDISVKSGTSLPFQKERRGQLARALYKDGVIDQQELLTTLEWPRKEEIMRRMNEEKAQQAEAEQGQQQAAPQGPQGMVG